MGKIKKMLAAEIIEPRSITAGSIWTDLCENVHLHYRNNRFDFSEMEFSVFRAAINSLGKAVEKNAIENQYREGDPNFLIQQIFNAPLKTDSEYYSNRATIELQKDNTVHFHYRDLRLHWTTTEFLAIANMFKNSLNVYADIKPFPYKQEEATLVEGVPIEMIQPYDEGHRPLAIDDVHREGIEYAKNLILEGKKLRPILVNNEGQRLDGFKRYMAHLELGLEKIDCYVDPFGQMGGQNNQGFLAD
jgi:hypothetical protein